ncbi:hypothetical protein [Longitalea luteola]|uniref:hypothetical protein n=1 Tax=Longitalea luteola TaxID=2812563 RepID=UPI001A96991D|nr:hypothetical protein [Longitalea luteola]
MDEGSKILMCEDAGALPLIKKVLYGVLIDNRQLTIGSRQAITDTIWQPASLQSGWKLAHCLLVQVLVLFLIMPYIVAVLFNQIACFLGDHLRNFLTCEPYQNFS